MKVVYSDQYDLNLGNHVFPSIKYRLIKEKLLRDQIASPRGFCRAPRGFGRRYRAGASTANTSASCRRASSPILEILRLEIPYSPELVRAVWLSAGGSILAGRLALEDGTAVNLGGGFHHAYPDHGEGFCVLNDFAIGIRRLQKDKAIERAMTVDCDVHQGNGTAAIFAGDSSCVSRSPSTR